MNTLECLMIEVRKFLIGILGKPYAAAAKDDYESVTLTPNVLVVVYDPVVNPATGQNLSSLMGWQSVDALLKGYTADIETCSGGLVKYKVVDCIPRNEFPVKIGGFTYNFASYRGVAERHRDPDKNDKLDVDYYEILKNLQEYNLVQRVNDGLIDEVWLFAYPYAGFLESIMAGACAFECNSVPLKKTSEFTRRFVIMGFSYERGVGEMLEDFCHRGESILGHIYKYARGEANLFARFTRYDQKYPGKAEVGTVHYAPNSAVDYDYNNTSLVSSGCEDWKTFPNFTGLRQPVNCEAWSDPHSPQDWIRQHHQWWLSHLPKVVGQTDGIANNWWKYIVDPNRV
jgi:hypothetical protein